MAIHIYGDSHYVWMSNLSAYEWGAEGRGHEDGAAVGLGVPYVPAVAEMGAWQQ